jgi:hypothetical protein
VTGQSGKIIRDVKKGTQIEAAASYTSFKQGLLLFFLKVLLPGDVRLKMSSFFVHG